MNNEPVAWGWYDLEIKQFFPHWDEDLMENKEGCIPLYTHPVKEQSTNERIEMLKEMVEKSANPVGWIGYHEGHLVSFLQTQEQVNSFLKNTDTAGRVEPVYTHPVKEQYKFGVDWSKDGNAVTVLKICEDGVAEVVFMDYQKATHPVKEQDESFDRTASHMAGEYVAYQKELTDEEILEIYYPFSLAKYQFNMASPMFDTLGFARAIMKRCGIISGTDK